MHRVYKRLVQDSLHFLLSGQSDLSMVVDFYLKVNATMVKEFCNWSDKLYVLDFMHIPFIIQEIHKNYVIFDKYFLKFHFFLSIDNRLNILYVVPALKVFFAILCEYVILTSDQLKT